MRMLVVSISCRARMVSMVHDALDGGVPWWLGKRVIKVSPLTEMPVLGQLRSPRS